jgi:hypothetical protein
MIKTIVAKGSLRENEFGKQADWIEIYNNGDQDINLGSINGIYLTIKKD